ncbi:hypothetical protein [Sulfuriferula thiophila]|uniref:hypothetical protein n=1 Tax=Sulfuriferula thiophila TaxID=1781211 RepID=UPI000F60C974|nr:hypothetical protein [Sulfuriferula thiophila]
MVTLVLGIGNTLLCDEGVGVHAVRAFVGADMDRFLGVNRKRSVHEVGLLDLMAVAHLAGHLPERRALIGIQPDIVGWGDAPTTAVAQAIPQACSLTLDLIAAWRT